VNTALIPMVSMNVATCVN